MTSAQALLAFIVSGKKSGVILIGLVSMGDLGTNPPLILRDYTNIKISTYAYIEIDYIVFIDSTR